MWLDTLNEKHYKALYEIAMRAEPYNSNMPYEQFLSLMSKREGYVVVAPSGELAGCISFSDYVPEMDISIHCFIDPKYHGRWAIKRDIYKTVFDFPFDALGLQRVSGYVAKGTQDKVGQFLLSLGFKHEGTIRKRLKWHDGNYYDIDMFGLLREERRW